MKNLKPLVCLITGPAGAGKSTTALALAKTMKISALIETDHIRHMIKDGFIKPSLSEGHEQLVLGRKNATILAKNFAKEGYNVIIADAVAGRKSIDIYHKSLKRYRFVIILLLPNRKVLWKRDSGRSVKARIGKRTLWMHDRFVEKMIKEKRWHVIDNSKMSIKQTVKKIRVLCKTKFS